MKICPKCNSEKIIRNGRVFETDHSSDKDLNIAVDEDPNALFFKERIYSPVKALVCGDCGFVEMYVCNPRIIWDAYQNQQKKLAGKE